MKRAPRSRQRHDLYAKYHDYDSEISDLLGECGLYKLDGLIAAATPYAEEKLIEIAAKKKMREDRLARKKPKLTLVKSD